MKVTRVSLGTIQLRGVRALDPSMVAFGPDESDFLIRHVEKVRELNETSPRGVFVAHSPIPSILAQLAACSDLQFQQHSKTLQDRLAKAMKTSTNAKDCVFAVVQSEHGANVSHITVLKLDAVVEAAETSIKAGKVSLRVLKRLIPEPGKLQKALSWPDPRATSDAILIDANFTHAEYFSAAFDLGASPRAPEAERALHKTIVEHVPLSHLSAAITDASAMDGPADEVLQQLAASYPELAPAVSVALQETRPAGIVRKNKVAALPITWTADGAKLTVPSDKASSVEVIADPNGSGWLLILHTASRPAISD